MTPEEFGTFFGKYWREGCGVAVALTTIVIGIVKIVPYLRRGGGWTVKTFAALDGLPSLAQKVEDVHKQVHANGGTSMSDQINLIRDRTLLNDAAFRAYQDADDVMTFRADAQGQFTWASDLLEQRLGLRESNVTGMGWLSGVADEDRDSVRKEWLSAVHDGRTFERLMSLRDGKILKMRASPVIAGRLKEWMGRCQDEG